MKNIRRLFATLGAAAVMSGVLGAPTAQAATDDKTYPASMCVRFSGGNPAYFGNGWRVNSGTTKMHVLCPIVRDTMESKFSKVEVIAVDKHDNTSPDTKVRDVKCWVQSMNSTGTAEFWSNSASTSGANTDPKPLAVYSTDLPTNPYGSYTLRCEIPPVGELGNSYLVKYFIAEP